MTRNSTSTMGAFHPVIFFIVVYGISLFMALFVCNAVYNSINGSDEDVVKEAVKKEQTVSYNPGPTASLR